MSAPTFDPVKHGPGVWALQGIRWREQEMGAAKVFKGWPAERLAGVLGLDVADVARVLGGPSQPAPAPPARVPGPSPRDVPARDPAERPAPAPRGPDLPAPGSDWEARRILTCWAYPGGGFTLDPRETGGGWRSLVGVGGVTIYPADLVRVQAHAGTHLLIRVDSQYRSVPVFVRVEAAAWAGLFRAA